MNPQMQARLDKLNDFGSRYTGLLSLAGLALTVLYVVRGRKA